MHHTVTFETGGGSEVKQQIVEHGKAATRPANTVWDGYALTGWKLGDSSYDFATPVTGDITLKAQWAKQVYWNVMFDAHAGRGASPKAQWVVDGEKAAEPTPVPTRSDGYVLEGWYTSPSRTPESKYDFSTPVHRHLLLHAKWTPNTRTVSFDSAGGSPVGSQSIPCGKQATRPANPTREGHTFGDWYATADCAGSPYVFGTELQGNLTLNAKWSCKHKVTFNSDGGDTVGEQVVEHGSKATEPPAPAKKNFAFVGWFAPEPDEPFDFDAPISDDVELTAHWAITSCDVAFDCHGGSAVQAQTVPYGDYVEPPDDPTRPDHTSMAGTWTSSSTAK